MGSRSSTTQVRKRDPESAELQNMRTSIYNMLAPITGAAPMSTVVPQTGGASAGVDADAAVSRGKPSQSFANGLPQGYTFDNRGQIVKGYKNGGDNEGAPIYMRNADGSIATVWNYNSGGGTAGQTGIPSAGHGVKWSDTNFGSDWLANRVRAANALNQYDTLSRNTQPLMDRITGTADRIIDTANGNLPYTQKIAGLSALIPGLSNKISGVGDRALEATETAAAAMKPNTQNISNLSGKIEGIGDRQGTLADEVLNFTRTGNIPDAVTENLNRSVNSELNRNTGSALNDLATRGVMNSSVANRSLDGLANSAADAYAKNYLNAYNSVLSGYGQTNSTLAGAGDTYAKAISGYKAANDDLRSGLSDQLAGFTAAGNLYGNAINGYNSAISGYNNVINGRNATINGYNTAMSGYGKALDSNTDLMKQAASMPQTLSQAMMSQYAPAYQFWKDLQNSYDNREDYDTVVKQGK